MSIGQLPAPAWRQIVDVGCGTGLGTIAFADARAHHGLHNVRVLGVDSSSTQVATAVESNARDGVEYRWVCACAHAQCV